MPGKQSGFPRFCRRMEIGENTLDIWGKAEEWKMMNSQPYQPRYQIKRRLVTFGICYTYGLVDLWTY